MLKFCKGSEKTTFKVFLIFFNWKQLKFGVTGLDQNNYASLSATYIKNNEMKILISLMKLLTP